MTVRVKYREQQDKERRELLKSKNILLKQSTMELPRENQRRKLSMMRMKKKRKWLLKNR